MTDVVCDGKYIVYLLIFLCRGKDHYTPASTKLKGGYTGFTLSVFPSIHLSLCPSMDKIMSALYLQQRMLDLFHIYTSYQATSEGVSV